MKILVRYFALLFAFTFLSADVLAQESNRSGNTTKPAEKNYKFLSLGSLSYDTVNQLCRPWLSEGGILTHEKPRNSILVYDTPEVIEKIAKFLREGQKEIYNIRVTVDFAGNSAGGGANFSVRDPKHPQRPPVTIINGKVVTPDNLQINTDLKRTMGTSNHSMTLMTADGMPATLWKGKTIVDPSWARLQDFTPDIIIATPNNVVVIPGNSLTDVKWADVGSSLKILPAYDEATGNIIVELYPSISYIDGKTKKEEAVKVKDLITTIAVKPGQRINVGSVLDSKRDKFINIFGPDFFRSGSEFSVTDIYVTCELLKPGDSRNSSLPRSMRLRDMR